MQEEEMERQLTAIEWPTDRDGSKNRPFNVAKSPGS